MATTVKNVTLATILFCLFIIVTGRIANTTRIELIGKYGEQLTQEINNTVEYIVHYTGNQDVYPVRVIVSSPTSSIDYPLLVVAQQQKQITSWQLPYIVNPIKSRMQYTIAGHTLCPGSISLLRTTGKINITPRFLTAETIANPVITIKSPSRRNRQFQLMVEMQSNFFLTSDQQVNTTVEVSKPVYFYYNFHDVGNDANDSGAVLVTAESESSACMLISVQNSTCPVFDLENNIKFDSYWQTMNFKAGIVVTKKNYPNGFYVVMVVKEDDNDCNRNSVSVFSLQRTKPVSIKVSKTVTLTEHMKIAMGTLAIFGGIFIVCTVIGLVYLIKSIKKDKNEVSLDLTDAGENLTNGHESNRWRQLFRASSRSKKSTNYVWHVGIVALFYTFPVLQLVFTYQGIVHETGNEDLCYYNFLCSHPLGFINDFNHVLSNIGYVFLGLLFIIITYVKELLERSTQNEMYGLPKPYGMFYALGFALIMEGVLSASYHICPKSSNFQFDTSFMYVMTVLMIVNIYENRHATGDSRGYAVFGILAAATTLSVIGLFIGEKLYFWIIFAIIQISLCFALTWALGRIVLWILGNVINWVVVGYGIYARSGFGTYLLMVLIINGLFYTIYYISMKICYKERILVITWIFIVMATIVWSAAMYFFVSSVTSWEKSPAESRNLNRACEVLRYYDSHDIWHFLSAVALFLTFLVLLTLDEGLSNVRRADITDFHSH